MNAAELREALEALDQLLGAFAEWVSDEQNDEARDWALVKLAPFASRAETIRDAARTIALPILEADPGYWLGIAINAAAETDLVGHPLSEEVLRALHTGVGAVLAAISTPTPMEES